MFADLDAAPVDLGASIAGLPASEHTMAMQEEVHSGIAAAGGDPDGLRAEIEATAPADEPTAGRRVPSFFGELEKVIDVVKPEIAGYAEPELTGAFPAVPSCQFGVKDVDDGVPRSND